MHFVMCALYFIPRILEVEHCYANSLSMSYLYFPYFRTASVWGKFVCGNFPQSTLFTVALINNWKSVLVGDTFVYSSTIASALCSV